ncbi:MAG: hypothetical protein ACKO4A_15700 [Gammaproteobacteria bacterium]
MRSRRLLSLCVCLVLTPTAAFADREHRHRHGHGHDAERYYRETRTRVVYRPVYVAPRPVVYAEPGYYYYPPRHAEHHHHHRCNHDRAMVVLGSAILAGAIVHELRH